MNINGIYRPAKIRFWCLRFTRFWPSPGSARWRALSDLRLNISRLQKASNKYIAIVAIIYIYIYYAWYCGISIEQPWYPNLRSCSHVSGPYTDLFGFLYESKPDGCYVTSCSESQAKNGIQGLIGSFLGTSSSFVADVTYLIYCYTYCNLYWWC